MAAAAIKAIRRMFRIQYVSDLHLELYDKAVFPQLVVPNARYLALAGDIGQPGSRAFHSFLSYVSGKWDRVFYVPGNHEYYTSTKKWENMHDAPTPFHIRHKELRESVGAHKNIYLLDSASPSYFCEEENMAVVGSTLWTHISDHQVDDAKQGMHDYSYIPVYCGTCGDNSNNASGIRTLHPYDTNYFHEQHRRVLSEQIEHWKRRGADVCMITHHLPSPRLISPRYNGDRPKYCFASSCEDLMQPHVKAWIYGHTHNAAVTAIGNTITACNARGYPNQHVSGFGRDVYLEIKTSTGEEDASNEELQLAAKGIM